MAGSNEEVLLTRNEFINEFVVEGEEEIAHWVKKGMPRKKVGKVYMYPRNACHRWHAGEEAVNE